MMEIEKQIEQIKERLVKARVRAGLTQTQAALLVGMSSASSLSQHEGARSTPTLRLFLKLCDIYGISPEWALTGRNPDFDPHPIMNALQNVKVSAHEALNILQILASVPNDKDA